MKAGGGRCGQIRKCHSVRLRAGWRLGSAPAIFQFSDRERLKGWDAGRADVRAGGRRLYSRDFR